MHFNITLLHKINILEFFCFSSVQVIISSTCYHATGEIFAVFTLPLHYSIWRPNRLTISKTYLRLFKKSQVVIQTDIFVLYYLQVLISDPEHTYIIHQTPLNINFLHHMNKIFIGKIWTLCIILFTNVSILTFKLLYANECRIEI